MKPLTSPSIRVANGVAARQRIERLVAVLFSEVALLVAAVMIVGMALFPWHLAATKTYVGVDPTLTYIDRQWNSGLGASVAPGGITLAANPRTQPIVHLLTSLTSFQASFRAVITSSTGYSGTPLEVKVWYPGTQSSVFIRYTSGGQIYAGTQELYRDQGSTQIGRFRPGEPSRIVISADPEKSIVFKVTSAGTTSSFAVGRDTHPTLLNQPYLDLSIAALGTVTGTASTHLQEFLLITPAKSYLTTKINDARPIAGGLLIAIWFTGYLLRRRLINRRAGRWRLRLRPSAILRRWWLPIPILALTGLLIALAFVDGHPYDRLSQETWAYVVQHYGLGSLYDRTIVAPDSAVRSGGPPWSTLGYSYLPGMTYPYAFFATVWHWLGQTVSPLHDRLFYVFWKTCFSIFILLDAFLIYWIARRVVGVSPRWSVAAAILFAINPAILFDAAVWGESDALLTAPILVATVGFFRGKPRMGFGALAVACLLKQTALLFVPIFLAYSLKRYGLRQSLQGGALAIVVGFLFIFPTVLAGYHPGTAFPGGFLQLLSFAFPQYTWVSPDTFSLWTLGTGLRGLHGFDRIWSPTMNYLPGTHIAFSTAGTLLLLLIVVGSIAFLVRRRLSERRPEMVLMFLSLIPIAYVELSTTASVRYLTLGLPLLLLSIRRVGSLIGSVTLGVYVALSAIATLSMWGVFTVIAARGDWPNFYILGNPNTNAITGFVHAVYTGDLGITGFALLLAGCTAMTIGLAFLNRRPLTAAVS